MLVRCMTTSSCSSSWYSLAAGVKAWSSSFAASSSLPAALALTAPSREALYSLRWSRIFANRAFSSSPAISGSIP
jgi:hypothetical protein